MGVPAFLLPTCKAGGPKSNLLYDFLGNFFPLAVPAAPSASVNSTPNFVCAEPSAMQVTPRL